MADAREVKTLVTGPRSTRTDYTEQSPRVPRLPPDRPKDRLEDPGRRRVRGKG